MPPEIARRLFDAYQACLAIEGFVRGVDFSAFLRSALIRSAVERQFEIIGEPLSKAARDEPVLSSRVPDIPRIVGLRNRLIYGDDSVDEEIVWDIVSTKLAPLKLRRELSDAGYPVKP